MSLLVTGGTSAAQIYAEHENTVLHGGRGIADDGEVLEVGLGLGDEVLAFLTRDGRERTAFHRRGPITKSLQHLIAVEVGHTPIVATTAAPREPTGQN